jgi:predicted outer membrane repeat protein
MFLWNTMLGVDSCTFDSNSAIEGGAVYAKGSLVKMSNSVFAKNAADIGTAVSNLGEDYNHLTFENCTFVQDAAKGCMFNLKATDVAEGAKYTSVELHDCTYTSTSPASCLGYGTRLLFDATTQGSTGLDSISGTNVHLATCDVSAGFGWLHTERKVFCMCSAG